MCDWLVRDSHGVVVFCLWLAARPGAWLWSAKRWRARQFAEQDPEPDYTPAAHHTKRKRFSFKQPAAAKAHARPRCKWPAGCDERGQRYLEGEWFCKRHAAWICGETAAVLTLTDYKDYLVATHKGSAMGDRCTACGAYNFQEERIGATAHFNICCQNGKVENIQNGKVANIRHCAPPPDELLEILQGNTAAMRQARQQLKQYNNAFAFVSYGENCFKDMHIGRGPPVTIIHGTV